MSGACISCSLRDIPHCHDGDNVVWLDPPKKPTTRHRGGKWPIQGEALACMPDQVPEVMAYERKRGVAIEYAKNGQPIYRNQADMNAHAKLHGMKNYSRYT